MPLTTASHTNKWFPKTEEKNIVRHTFVKKTGDHLNKFMNYIKTGPAFLTKDMLWSSSSKLASKMNGNNISMKGFRKLAYTAQLNLIDHNYKAECHHPSYKYLEVTVLHISTFS